MYYYIIDPQKLPQRQFERVQNELYSSLSQYRMAGESMRVSGLRPTPQLVESAFSHNAKTIIAVGNDETLHDVINSLKGRDVVIGFVPLYKTELSQTLGLDGINNACKYIALRRIALMDVGTVNSTLFLSKLSFGLGLQEDGKVPNSWNLKIIKNLFNQRVFDVSFSADESYKATLKVLGGMIINTRGNSRTESLIANPTDGILDVLLLPQLSRFKLFKYRKHILSGAFENIPESSLVHLKKIEISNPEGLPLKVGNRVIAKSPAIIEVIPQSVKIIVGRERQF